MESVAQLGFVTAGRAPREAGRDRYRAGEKIVASALTLVLVHRAWHGPWCWELLIEQLSGVELRTVALASSGSDPSTLGDLYDDAETVRSAVADVDGPGCCWPSWSRSNKPENASGCRVKMSSCPPRWW